MRVSQRGIIIQIKAGECCCPCLECLADETKQKSFIDEIWKSNSRRFNVSAIPHLQRLRNKQAELKKKEFRKLKF